MNLERIRTIWHIAQKVIMLIFMERSRLQLIFFRILPCQIQAIPANMDINPVSLIIQDNLCLLESTIEPVHL